MYFYIVLFEDAKNEYSKYDNLSTEKGILILSPIYLIKSLRTYCNCTNFRSVLKFAVNMNVRT